MSAPEPRAYADRSVDTVIGENVHRLMWRRGDTQLGVAPLLGMTQGALSKKLRGTRPWFASEINAVAQRYGVSRDDLFSPDFNPDTVGPAVLETATSTVESGRFAPDWVAPVIPMRRAS